MNKVFKQVLGWFIAAIFFFPIYFWITVSIKKDKDIFALHPKLFDFEVTSLMELRILYSNLLSVLGDDLNEVLGNFLLLPRLNKKEKGNLMPFRSNCALYFV